MTPTWDDLVTPEERRECIGPRHARITLTEAFMTGLDQGIRGGLTAAFGRDVPTSTPNAAAQFQRIWRTS